MRSVLVAFLLSVGALCALGQKPKTVVLTGNRPVFAAIAMDGSRVDTNDLKGKIVVLNLWFANCPNCIAEIAQLNQFVDDNAANKDVVFIGLAASAKPVLEKFLQKNPFKYKVIPNAQMIILSKFGQMSSGGDLVVPFPMHIVIDRTGLVVARAEGIKGLDVVKSELARQLSAPKGSGDQ